MKYAINYDHLAERYDTLTYQQSAPEEVLQLDRHYFASWPKKRDIRVIGLDISREAVRYAEDCGILDVGIVADLENEDISPLAAQELSKVDLLRSEERRGGTTV